jgi:oligoendopeptidase F
MSYTATRWKLDALVSDQNQATLDKALLDLEKKVRKVEGWRKKLKATLSVKDFLALLRDYEAMSADGQRLYAYSALRFYADTNDAAALAQFTQMQERIAQAQNRTLFFSLWWKALDDARAKRLMNVAGDLRYWLETMRQMKPYTLSEAEEKIINLKDVTGFRALDNLYDQLTSGYAFMLEVDGQKHTLTRDALSMYFRSPKPELRAAAYQELLRIYGENAPVLAQI